MLFKANFANKANFVNSAANKSARTFGFCSQITAVNFWPWNFPDGRDIKRNYVKILLMTKSLADTDTDKTE